MPDNLLIAGRTFRSRLIVGTGKFQNFDVMQAAHLASGADMVTVAIRRLPLDQPSEKNILDYIDRTKFMILPNTAGCYTVNDAIRIARLSREMGLGNFIKLEVIGDPKYLVPDVVATIEATRQLVEEGFVVLPYTSDDLTVAKRLLEAGAATIMPGGSFIGTGQGVPNFQKIKVLREFVNVPLIVDSGIGTASDAALAMETGADAVLTNTAIAEAGDPVVMGEAMKLAVEAGRKSYLSGRMSTRPFASASSPTTGTIGTNSNKESVAAAKT